MVSETKEAEGAREMVAEGGGGGRAGPRTTSKDLLGRRRRVSWLVLPPRPTAIMDVAAYTRWAGLNTSSSEEASDEMKPGRANTTGDEVWGVGVCGGGGGGERKQGYGGVRLLKCGHSVLL